MAWRSNFDHITGHIIYKRDKIYKRYNLLER